MYYHYSHFTDKETEVGKSARRLKGSRRRQSSDLNPGSQSGSRTGSGSPPPALLLHRQAVLAPPTKFLPKRGTEMERPRENNHGTRMSKSFSEKRAFQGNVPCGSNANAPTRNDSRCVNTQPQKPSRPASAPRPRHLSQAVPSHSWHFSRFWPRELFCLFPVWVR